MAAKDLKTKLLKPVNECWRDDVAGWLDALDERFLEALECSDWSPGVDSCLRAFKGSVRPQVVWLGQTPYEGEGRATGLSFLDGTVGPLFSDGVLDASISQATSLRNFLKAWFRADGRLKEGCTSKEHVRTMCKDGLVQELNEVFERGIKSGWLWLNAGLSIGGHLDKSAHVCGWRPFVSRAIASASEAKARVVLLGDWAKTYRSDVQDQALLVEAPHPRKEAFVENDQIRALLRKWKQLIHQ